MKKFIVQFYKFSLVVFSVLLLSIFLIVLIMSKISFQLPQEKTILILGDSSTECAIDDTIFPVSANLSQAATPYMYSFVKLRKFIEVNDQIDTVILSFHYGSLLKGIDDIWLFGDEIFSSHFTKYFYLFGKEEYLAFLGKPIFYLSVLRLPIRNISTIFKIFKNRNVSYKNINIGGYANLKNNNLKEDILARSNERIEIKSNEDIRRINISLFQLKYLQKIAQLCKEKEIELILMSTPVYDPEKYGFAEELLDYHHTYMKEIKYLNCMNFSIPDSGYGDINHLNNKGAEIFSRHLLNIF
jgi:hypothetical protein